MKRNFLKGNYLTAAFCIAITFFITLLVFYFYKSDEASTVTVLNGMTEIYNGVSLGDVVVAALSIIVTLVLGIFTYTQNKITIENETWDKTPFFEIVFDGKEKLKERAKEAQDQIEILKDECCDDEMDVAINSFEQSELKDELALFSKKTHFRKFVCAHKINEDYKSYLEIPIKSVNDIKIFSVDIYEIIEKSKKYEKKYFSKTKDMLSEDIRDICESIYLISEDKQAKISEDEQSKIDRIENIINNYALPEVMGVEKGEVNIISIPLEPDEIEKLIEGITTKDGKPVRKIFGLNIKTTNDYVYNQVVMISLMLFGERSDYQEIICSVSSYNTEIVAGELDNHSMKKVVDKLIKKEEENIKKYR